MQYCYKWKEAREPHKFGKGWSKANCDFYPRICIKVFKACSIINRWWQLETNGETAITEYKLPLIIPIII